MSTSNDTTRTPRFQLLLAAVRGTTAGIVKAIADWALEHFN
jgi:hypothetical protein